MIYTGGHRWKAADVGWGKPGVRSSSEVLGYFAGQAQRGRLSDADRKKRVVNVWDIHAVYSIFAGDKLLYVGEGKLGDCLHRHYRTDHLIGRWDSFTWLSPYKYSADANGIGQIAGPQAADLTVADAKKCVELLELASIILCDPPTNSQLPAAEKQIKWMDQERSEHAEPTVLSEVAALKKTIEELKAKIPCPQND